ncbi:MAG TPA: hypothetical protein VKA68_18460 [bacterium]|nr:hypothetical protein [bacterium]
MNKLSFVILAVAGILLSNTNSLQAQDYFYSSEMSVENYHAELEFWQSEIQSQLQQKAQLEKEIAAIQEQITETKQEIARIRHETLRMLSGLIADPSDPGKEYEAYANAPLIPESPKQSF